MNLKVAYSLQVYIVGPLIASLIGAFCYELIFSFPLREVVFVTDKVEVDGSGSPASTPVKEPEIVLTSQDIVISNKNNGDLAYD
jgi:hypothetical protein